jgi:hypothetical protein
LLPPLLDLRPPRGNRRLCRLLVPGRIFHHGAHLCGSFTQIAYMPLSPVPSYGPVAVGRP